MQKILAILLLSLCAACSGGVHSSLVEMEMRIASPAMGWGDSGVPVVYPAQGNPNGDPMVQAYGPSWENMEKDLVNYNFNP